MMEVNRAIATLNFFRFEFPCTPNKISCHLRWHQLLTWSFFFFLNFGIYNSNLRTGVDAKKPARTGNFGCYLFFFELYDSRKQNSIYLYLSLFPCILNFTPWFFFYFDMYISQRKHINFLKGIKIKLTKQLTMEAAKQRKQCPLS